jgi:tetratricopeptide (TPR) repeat protein
VESINPLILAEDGKKEYGKGNFKAAAELFAQAAQAYASLQDALNAAEMKNNESVALLQAGKAKESLRATDGTEEVFQKAGDIKRQGIAVSNRAAALEGLKKWQEALAEYDRAASLFE